MSRQEAKALAEITPAEDLKAMFIKAQETITDWHKPSNISKGLSIGKAFNILSACLKEDASQIHRLTKVNMIREFGQYLPNYKKPTKEKPIARTLFYEEPKFIK